MHTVWFYYLHVGMKISVKYKISQEFYSVFGNKRLVQVFSMQQHIVDGQSVRNTDLVIFY